VSIVFCTIRSALRNNCWISSFHHNVPVANMVVLSSALLAVPLLRQKLLPLAADVADHCQSLASAPIVVPLWQG